MSRESLRKWMIAARFWTSRRDRAAQAHQPRPRRECLAELVQTGAITTGSREAASGARLRGRRPAIVSPPKT